MRPAVFVLLCALLCAPAVAQEPEPSPTPETPAVDILPTLALDFSVAPPPEPKKKDIWEWAPHLTLNYGKTTDGHVKSRFWYGVQARRTDIEKATTLGADLSAGRWSLSASTTTVPDRPDLKGSAFGLNLAVAKLGPIRPGVSTRYSTSENATLLFSSGGTSIASASRRRLLTAGLDVSVGRYDRSYVRIEGMYGNASLNDSLDLFVQGRVADSPLAIHHYSHSDFWGIGASAAVRLYGISLEGTVACYRPHRPSVALPGDECIVTGGGSALLPVWLKFGSGAGVFIRYTRVNDVRPPDHSSTQFLNDSVTMGLTARIP